LESQQLEFRLAKNLMLPSLNLKYGYSQPNADWRFTPSGATQFNGFGLGFQSGLFLRQQRGQYRQMQLTVKNASLEVNNKMRSYQVKSNALFQEYSVNKDQWLQWKQIGENQLLLYRMEAKRLEAGDVNFFILNTREMRLLDLNLTALEYKYQYQASGVAYLHYLGWLR
jgi:outer membrane protein TolC